MKRTVGNNTLVLTVWHSWDAWVYAGRWDICSQRSGGPVDHDVSKVAKQLLGPVLGGWELEQVGVLVDEVGVHHARQELRVS